MTFSLIANDGAIRTGGFASADALSAKRNSAKSPVFARSSGRMPMICTCRVIGWPLKVHLISPITSIVGAIASTSSPATCLIRAITSSEFQNPSRSYDSTTTSARTPWSRSRILSANPAITELTTIIVATPSITLTTLASAM